MEYLLSGKRLRSLDRAKQVFLKLVPFDRHADVHQRCSNGLQPSETRIIYTDAKIKIFRFLQVQLIHTAGGALGTEVSLYCSDFIILLASSAVPICFLANLAHSDKSTNLPVNKITLVVQNN